MLLVDRKIYFKGALNQKLNLKLKTTYSLIMKVIKLKDDEPKANNNKDLIRSYVN